LKYRLLVRVVFKMQNYEAKPNSVKLSVMVDKRQEFWLAKGLFQVEA